MNTSQQPASDVAVSLLTSKAQYQKVAGMRSFSNSLVTVLSPMLATSILAFMSMEAVVIFDLITFFIAFIALGRNSSVWCIGAILGWIFIPVMSANIDVLFRLYIPIDMQERVYSARNTLQFFTIPVGYLIGGVLVDKLFEPLMAKQSSKSILVFLVGSGKGSGAALLFLGNKAGSLGISMPR